MLGTAVIVGDLGRQHARIHAALTAEEVRQFASVCDLDEAQGRRIAAEYSTSVTTDWRTLIQASRRR